MSTAKDTPNPLILAGYAPMINFSLHFYAGELVM